MARGDDQISVDLFAKALVEAMKSQTPTSQMLTGMSQERLERVTGRLDKPIFVRRIRGRSLLSDATMTFVVVRRGLVASTKRPHGRIVEFEDWALPHEWYSNQLVADGARPGSVWRNPSVQLPTIDGSTPKHMLSLQFQKARADLWIEDLRRFSNGAALRPEYCVDPTDLQTVEWEETKLHEAKLQPLNEEE